MVNTHSKGYRGEHELEQELRHLGIPARRVPMSGQAFHTGDLLVQLGGRELVAEVKSLRLNFMEYGLLEHSGIVFKRTCRPGQTGSWLAVLPLELLARTERQLKHREGMLT